MKLMTSLVFALILMIRLDIVLVNLRAALEEQKQIH